ncbi:hypothetical protein VD0004_g841 [Verticillium dahliae]|nr:hypothetical protein VD0004_g841 [Verticillium dahliae]
MICKILVFRGTGPAGSYLLRELVYSERGVISYAKSLSKIPQQLGSNRVSKVGIQ